MQCNQKINFLLRCNELNVQSMFLSKAINQQEFTPTCTAFDNTFPSSKGILFFVLKKLLKNFDTNALNTKLLD